MNWIFRILRSLIDHDISWYVSYISIYLHIYVYIIIHISTFKKHTVLHLISRSVRPWEFEFHNLEPILCFVLFPMFFTNLVVWTIVHYWEHSCFAVDEHVCDSDFNLIHIIFQYLLAYVSYGHWSRLKMLGTYHMDVDLSRTPLKFCHWTWLQDVYQDSSRPSPRPKIDQLLKEWDAVEVTSKWGVTWYNHCELTPRISWHMGELCFQVSKWLESIVMTIAIHLQIDTPLDGDLPNKCHACLK